MPESEVIRSRDNSRLKLVRAVRDGRESEFIFIEGTRLVHEAIKSGVNLEQVFVAEGVDPAAKIPSLADWTFVERRLFDSVSDTENSQGIIAIARRPPTYIERVRDGLVVLLHRVNNPSNLGAVVRTAEAAGCAGLITTRGSADAFSPKALRSSMGSAFRLPIIEKWTFDDAIAWARSRGMVTTAADISGSAKYTDAEWTVPKLVVFGSEAHGLDERELAMIDEKIIIPMENEVESLNLAVSSGVVLFEAKRQRDA